MSSDVTHSIRLFKNTRANGSSSVAFAEQPAISANTAMAYSADLDLDGRRDFVYQEAVTNDRVVWLRNLGGFAFAAAATVCTLPTGYVLNGNLETIAAVDLDADGDVDLVVSASNSSGASYGLFFCENKIRSAGGRRDASASFAPAALMTTVAVAVNSLAVADLDGDGLLDIATGSPSLYWVRRRTLSPPTFGPPVLFGSVPSAWSIAFRGDFNRDGLVDGLVASPFPYANSQVTFFRNVHTPPPPPHPQT